MNKQETTDKFNPKTALLLAGKLVTKASKVVTCVSPFQYSKCIDELENAITDYNNYIFKYPMKDGK